MSITAHPSTRWRYDTVAGSVGRDPTLFPPTGVVGEIKPHSRSGIAAGVAQLRRRLADPALRARARARATTLQLVTYRQVPSDPTRYDVLLADPHQLGTVVRAGRGSVTTWYRIGQVVMRDAVTPIPLWQCPTMLGNRLEPKVRAMYQGWMRNVQGHHGVALRNRSPQAPDADFSHEGADFLRELASELEQQT